MINEEKCFPIEQSYINLAIVETEEQREKEKKLSHTEHKNAIIGTFEEIYGTKTAVDIKDIFGKCKDETKKVLILGRAGIGKSTFCQYVAYRWAKGEMWTHYQLVVLIQLRSLTNTRYPAGRKYSSIDLVNEEYLPDDIIPEEDKRRFKERCKRGEVLWLLDGYDEFIQNIPPQLQDVFDLILEMYHHILTSRPYLIALSYNVKMEITGFTDDNIPKYIEQFFEQINDRQNDLSAEGQKLLSFLKSNPSIWGVAHIPVNLELICSLCGNIEQSKATILTMTELYDNMTEWLCQRYLSKQKNCSRYEILTMTKEDIYERSQKELIFLENLAFQAMKSNTLILQPPSIEKALKDADVTSQDKQYIFNIGFLKPFGAKPMDHLAQTKKEYYFVHLSFQEHFAARYLVHALSGSLRQQAIQFITYHKYNQRFALVFAFMSGLFTGQTPRAQLYTFWNTLLNEPLDLVGFRHIQLLLSCLNEAVDRSDNRRHLEFIDKVTKWIRYAVTYEYKIIFDDLFNSFRKSTSLGQEQIIEDHLLHLLQGPNSDTKQKTCKLIFALSTYNPRPTFTRPLIVALADDDENVRIEARQALVEIGQKALTNEVISKLVSVMDDEDDYVRHEVCEVLGELGEKAATYEVISKLLNRLEDENNFVRYSACWALGKMGERAATAELVTKPLLVSALNNENPYVQHSAWEVFSKMGEKAATGEVISMLVNALSNRKSYVRNMAWSVLGKMGEKAATNEVICMLVYALDDKNESVRSSACEVLGKMGEKAATDELISKLISTLGDENTDVRRTACDALGKIGKKTVMNEVISKLVSALDDRNKDIRCGVCAVLDKIGEKAETNDVISKLVSALDDESKDVRRRVYKFLGKMSGKAATDEVIRKLVSALDDEKEYVKYGVCEVLGKMGGRTATNEVINKLLSALDDENSDVRCATCGALGEMGESAVTNEVISKLLNALDEEKEDARNRACESLGKMGEKGTINKVISKLINALADKNWHVRSRACVVLGEMAEKLETNEMISMLLSALTDENHYVTRGACEVLGKMGEKAASAAVISKLVSALDDKSEDVRYGACEVLGKMGEKAAMHEVVGKLVNALDENGYVSRGAREALSEMGEKAVTNEVISKLLRALDDRSESISSSACEALGKMGG